MSAKNRKDLEDVLNEYLAAETVPSHESLKRWIKMFPEYKTELTDFTIHWGLMEHAPHLPEEQQSDEDILVLRAMSIVDDCLHAYKQKQDSDKPIANLLDEPRRIGLDLQDVARKCKITMPLLVKLGRRLIDPKTIPRELVQAIADLFGRSPQSLQAYFKGPVLANGMHFSSKKRPNVQKLEDFFDAVRSDTALDQNLLQYWLSIEKHADFNG